MVVITQYFSSSVFISISNILGSFLSRGVPSLNNGKLYTPLTINPVLPRSEVLYNRYRRSFCFKPGVLKYEPDVSLRSTLSFQQGTDRDR